MFGIGWLVIPIIFLYGLMVGSFLNAWIWRIHTRRKITKGRSMCPHCKTTLRWFELVPVLSWLGLRGKCRSCHKSISWQYPAVELTNAGLWVALFCYLQPNDLVSWVSFGFWIALASPLIAAFVYDARWMLLPDAFMVPAVVLALAIAALDAVGSGALSAVVPRLVAGGLFAGIFFLIWYVSRGRWIGDGDIWLAGIMGLALTTTSLMVAIFVAFNLGAIIGVLLMLAHKKTRKSSIAFGPFLIIGLFTGLFWGEALLNWYLQILF
jgi:leader peptidase (prepilin peptidase)/N-methyltransferase